MNIIRYNKKKNREVFICWIIIAVILTLAYSFEVIVGNRTSQYLMTYLMVTWIPIFFCYGLNLVIGTDDLSIKYYICAGYLIFYAFTMFTTQRISTWVYIIPLIAILIVYNDYKLITVVYSAAIIINIIEIAVNKYKDITFMISIADTEIQIGCLVLSAYFTIRGCKLLSYGNTKLVQLNEEITKDDLTLANNRYFLTNFLEDKFVRREVTKDKKDKNSSNVINIVNNISLAVVDIDSFKSINDSYGHRFGDLVLKKVSSILIKNIDGLEDTHVVRIGGDEFIIISALLNKEELFNISEQCCKQISDAKISYGDTDVEFHVSIGVANSIDSNVNNYNDLYIIADTNLYKAKNSGKNSVMK